jgi:hypothetical protein
LDKNFSWQKDSRTFCPFKKLGLIKARLMSKEEISELRVYKKDKNHVCSKRLLEDREMQSIYKVIRNPQGKEYKLKKKLLPKHGTLFEKQLEK